MPCDCIGCLLYVCVPWARGANQALLPDASFIFFSFSLFKIARKEQSSKYQASSLVSMDDHEHDEQYWLARRHRALFFSSLMATARTRIYQALREGDIVAYLFYSEIYHNSRFEFEATIAEFP